MISHERLKILLRYIPATGNFIYRAGHPKAGQTAGHLQPSRKFSTRNGSSLPYWTICLDGKQYFRAKLAWFYTTGTWPVDEIDHRDRDSTNDRWENLREATRALNNANREIFLNNRSGIKGVHRSGRKWRAMISVGGRNKSLGYFDDPNEAANAYAMAATAAFGSFANISPAQTAVRC